MVDFGDDCELCLSCLDHLRRRILGRFIKRRVGGCECCLWLWLRLRCESLD
jgi:hypothetical protein